jgi:hypothetical protein
VPEHVIRRSWGSKDQSRSAHRLAAPSRTRSVGMRVARDLESRGGTRGRGTREVQRRAKGSDKGAATTAESFPSLPRAGRRCRRRMRGAPILVHNAAERPSPRSSPIDGAGGEGKSCDPSVFLFQLQPSALATSADSKIPPASSVEADLMLPLP